MSDKRARAFMITGNNPEKYYCWAKSKDNENTYLNIANKAIKTFVQGTKNHKDRSPEKNGAVCVVEEGQNKTLHFHLYVCSKNPIRFSALQKLFPHSQIEVSRGTVAQTLDYLHKRGKHKESKSVTKCEPVYWGEHLCDNRGLTGNSLMDEIDEMLINGATPEDIYATAPKYAFYSGAIERTYAARKVNEIPNFQDVFVEYHIGESGTGKTYTYIQLCNNGLSEEVYLVSGDYKNPWDLYDFTKHKILFLDELRAGCFRTSTLLNITDGYKMTLPARYANKHKNWNRVIISTVIPPEQLFYSSLSGVLSLEVDSFEQFKRRLNIIIYHYIDEYFTGNQKYRYISVEPKAYKDLKQIKGIAEQEKLNHGGLCYEVEQCSI